MCISPEDAPKGAKPEEGDVSGLRRGTRPPNEADPVPRMVSRGAIRGLLGRESSRPKPSGENVAVQHRDSHVRSGRLGARCPGRQTGPLSKAAARDKASDPKSSHKTLRVKIVRPAVLYRRWMNTKKRKKKNNAYQSGDQGCSGQGSGNQGGGGQGGGGQGGGKRKRGSPRTNVGRGLLGNVQVEKQEEWILRGPVVEPQAKKPAAKKNERQRLTDIFPRGFFPDEYYDDDF